MRRTSVMTIGFVLIFIGIQLNLVKTYVLTPRFSNFLSVNAPRNESDSLAIAGNPNFDRTNPAYNSPYYQASFPRNAAANQQPVGLAPMMTQMSAPARAVSPPNWFCWPVLFMGTVMLLHGISMRRDWRWSGASKIMRCNNLRPQIAKVHLALSICQQIKNTSPIVGEWYSGPSFDDVRLVFFVFTIPKSLNIMVSRQRNLESGLWENIREKRSALTRRFASLWCRYG